MKLRSLASRLSLYAYFPLTLLSGLYSASAVTKFDFNVDAAPPTSTQAGWVAANLGVGEDDAIEISTVAVGGATLDSRDRTGTANDAGGGDEPAMWNDFIFANGSFAATPGSGLQLTITGLAPNTVYTLKLWSFDDASNAQLDGFDRAADWSDSSGVLGTLGFPSGPDPVDLSDYSITFNSTADAEGTIVLTGLVAALNPSSSHNVFLNGLEISDPLLDSDMDDLPDSLEQLIIDADPDDDLNTLLDVLPTDDFDNDFSTNLAEVERMTDPLDSDSDDDLLLDGVEDGLGTWVNSSQTGTDPLNPDTDGDNLLDGIENHDLPYDPANPTSQPGSDPNLPDTDEDGYFDSTELIDGTDPTNPNSFLDPLGPTLAKFDFNAPGSSTQPGWTGAEAGIGSNGTVSINTSPLGAVSVDTRDRVAINTNTGDIANNNLWRDFVFANGSLASAPDTGLTITLSGLAPLTTYPIMIWAFDESSDLGRVADWRAAGGPTQATLTFPTEPDPTSLSDYTITIEVSTDETGTAVIEGVVGAETPAASHNVFVNALAVGLPTGSTLIRITDINYDTNAETITITWESTPGTVYAIDLTTDLTSWPGDITDDVEGEAGADLTSFTFSTGGLAPRSYFRVRVVGN